MQKTDECVNSSDFLSTSQLEAFDLIKAFVRACVSVCVRAEDNETHRRRTEEIVKTALVRMWIHYCGTLSHTHPSLPQQDSRVACTVKVWVCVGVCLCVAATNQMLLAGRDTTVWHEEMNTTWKRERQRDGD